MAPTLGIQGLKCEYINAKKIIKEWIEEERSTYFIDIQEAIEHCGHRSVAKYFNKRINSSNHMYFNNNIYCYKNNI